MWRNLVLNKVTCGRKQYQHGWSTFVFLLCHLEQNSNFSHNLRSVFLLITGKSVNCLHFANVTSNVRSCVDSLGKSSKSNDTRVFSQSCKGKQIFLFNLELQKAFFKFENLPCWNSIVLTDYLSDIIFFRFKVSITHLWIDFLQ